MTVRAGLAAASLWLVVGTVCAQAPAAVVPPPAAPPPATLGHSALLTVEGGVGAAGTLILRIHRGGETGVLTAAQLSGVSASAAGRALPVTPQTDGTWSVALRDAAGKAPGTLDLVVGHDGIREIVTLQVPDAPAADGRASGGGLGAVFGRNKQLAWWILNIAIVLIAAIAISRRTS
jgi:hypothetical protein